MTKVVSECLLTPGGIIAIVDLESVGNDTGFNFQIENRDLCYKSNLLSLVITEKLMEHLMREEDATIFFYGGNDRLARRYLGSVAVTRDMLIYAQGILWTLAQSKKEEEDQLAKESKGDKEEGVEVVTPIASRPEFAGLKIPPSLDVNKTDAVNDSEGVVLQ